FVPDYPLLLSSPTRRSSDLIALPYHLPVLHRFKVHPVIPDNLFGFFARYRVIVRSPFPVQPEATARVPCYPQPSTPDKAEKVTLDRKSTRLNSSHVKISYAV